MLACIRFLLLGWLCTAAPIHAASLEDALSLRDIYNQVVNQRLSVPIQEQAYYAELAKSSLSQAGLSSLPAQYLLLMDRNALAQAIFLFWISPAGNLELIGASPASSSTRGGFEHFETPIGVFDHSRANQDFRAEGTRNSKGIRGYGRKGMRVYDFGWVLASKTWRAGTGDMRLQLHSTDPDYLEPRLGTPQSKGCIRIPAALNELIDHYGILDEGYERALAQGKHGWLLRQDREPTPWSGRYLIIVDSARTERPDWSPLPEPMRRKQKAQPADTP